MQDQKFQPLVSQLEGKEELRECGGEKEKNQY